MRLILLLLQLPGAYIRKLRRPPEVRHVDRVEVRNVDVTGDTMLEIIHVLTSKIQGLESITIPADIYDLMLTAREYDRRLHVIRYEGTASMDLGYNCGGSQVLILPGDSFNIQVSPGT